MDKFDKQRINLRKNEKINIDNLISYNHYVSPKDFVPEEVENPKIIDNKITKLLQNCDMRKGLLQCKSDKEYKWIEGQENYSSFETHFLAYSKSTRKNHIDHRAWVDKKINTLTCGEGCGGFSTANFISTQQGYRYLTPTEAESLMLWKYNYTQYGIINSEKKELSDTQRYKLIGNGVIPTMSRAVYDDLIGNEYVKGLSLCTGVGGLEMNLPDTCEIIAHAEKDKLASSVLKYHYPNIENLGDISSIREIKHDVLFAGFSCQSYSSQGSRKGRDDKKHGALFDYLINILRINKPKYFIFENVKGLLTHDKGITFNNMLEELSELGYTVDYKLLNSCNFGTIQNRERVFIVGKML